MDIPASIFPRDDDAAVLNDVAWVQRRLLDYMIHVVGKAPEQASSRDWFYALAYFIRGVVGERLMRTGQTQPNGGRKRIYYLSMEYLTGRSLWKYLLDLGVADTVRKAFENFEIDLDAVAQFEFDAALGNGGLGRLAACFLDSMATHGYPGFGYGIRYEFGMFTQRVEDGQQVEHPENWLRYGNPWEFERPSVIYPVRFHGRIVCFKEGGGVQKCQWVDTDEVIALAYDIPVSGFHSNTIANLRLWSARSTRDFDLRYFNEGNYIDAVKQKTVSENLSKVLYPNDATATGQELRLKQEYFFVSASLQDILARTLKAGNPLDRLPDLAAIQLNDTHPALAIPEMMRLLTDHHGYEWAKAWDITTRVFSYTNHTLLPEALETWPVHILESVLPRHLEIIYRINDQHLARVRYANPGNAAILRKMSLVDDEARRIRMAHLAVVGSHKVNGVAELHGKLLRTATFPDFDRLDPGKFVSVTNGITQRRWLLQANPELAALIGERLGDRWITDLAQLRAIAELADDSDFRARFAAVKRRNKERLARLILQSLDMEVDPESLFDVQVKRIHEYKRQLLNLLHVVVRYNRIRDGRAGDMVKRTVIFSGKAAPGYFMAKLIVRLVNDVAEVVNNDPVVAGLLKVAFIPNYNVSLAEVIIPGSDLSEQISTAGTEASGTGNMKFALNGALTIGTLDGANIEMAEEIGADNMFIFGLDADQARELRAGGYDPWRHYHENDELRRAIDMIGQGFFAPDEPGRYRSVVDALTTGGDHFLLLADHAAYVACQERVDALYRRPEEWTRKAILNVARVGKFSSDRAIHAYARDIWGVGSLNA
jgi:starch phosphorylase